VGIHHYRDWSESEQRGPAQLQRQRDYSRLYAQKWEAYAPPDRALRLRRYGWRLFQKLTGLRINSARRLGGLDGRDWCNTWTARYVSPLDPIRTRGLPYHLVQRPPRQLRPLPPEPV
jgi:hypothetical protein